MALSTSNVWKLRSSPGTGPWRIRDAATAWRSLASAIREAQSTVDKQARPLVGDAWSGRAADTYHEHRGRVVRDSADVTDAATEVSRALDRIADLLAHAEESLAERLRDLGTRVKYSKVGDELVFETVLPAQEQEVIDEVEYAKRVRSALEDELTKELGRIRAQRPVIANAGRRWGAVADGSRVDWAAPGAATGVRVIETGTSIIIGGDGANDRITVGAGKVTVNGVDYAIPPGKSLTVLGGGGNDQIDVAGDADLPVTLVGSGGNDTIRYVGGGAATIVGGAGNDTVDTTGSAGDNWIAGGRGNDHIDAGDGNDRIYGGLGDDTILAGGGNDRVSGGEGNDRIAGGDGHDRIAGDAGSDTVIAGGGHDWVSGGDGNDRIAGQDGMDTIFGDRGSDDIRGGARDDFVFGGSGSDVIDGGPGDNTIYGDGGDDGILGGVGTEYLDGGTGHDTIIGVRGNDVIVGGAGNDRISARPDDPTTVPTWEGPEFIPGSVEVSGGEGHDTIVVGSGENKISGGDGNDAIWAGSGDDTIVGGRGNDKIFASGGFDRIDGGDGHDTISGGTGDDEIHGGSGNDWIRGGSGGDYIDGGAGNDRLAGEAGDDVVYGLDGADKISGGPGDDYLEGGRGADTIDGGAGNDVVSGGRGADTLRGGAGMDVIYAGEGADAVDGGAGQDKVFIHDEDHASNAEHTVHMEPRGFRTGVTVEGSDEFRSRVEADLDLFASSSPSGQSMLGELDDEGVVIRESHRGASFVKDERNLNYDPSSYEPGFLPSTSLFHEMAHVYDYTHETAAAGVYDGQDIADKPIPGQPEWDVYNMERVAVGLPIDHDNDPSTPEIADPRHPMHLTENALREEMGVPPREHYR